MACWDCHRFGLELVSQHDAAHQIKTPALTLWQPESGTMWDAFMCRGTVVIAEKACLKSRSDVKVLLHVCAQHLQNQAAAKLAIGTAAAGNDAPEQSHERFS